MEVSERPKPAIAYLGPPSSYTHQATVDNFDQLVFSFEPEATIQDVFTAVQASDVLYGVVPFENSSNGAVVQTLDLFADRQSQHPDTYVCGEAYIAVHHCLLGFSDTTIPDPDPESGECTPTTKKPQPAKSKVKPRKNVQHIKRIYSHPQAFGQCDAFLSVHVKGVDKQEVSSTSKAAQIVANDPTKCSAAISSRMAAEVHGLDILAAGIEDRPDNETRFLVLKRGNVPTESENTTTPSFLRCVPDSTGSARDWKTLVSLMVRHEQPGALSRVLEMFRDFKLNLTSINSRPSKTRPWHYTFLMEFEGTNELAGASQVNSALERLKDLTEGCRWHGTWRKQGGY